MPQYNAQSIEQLFKNHASLRISKKRRGDKTYKGDGGYWDGGRCEYGAAHNLKEDCETLAEFFAEIAELKDARNKLIKFNDQQEFERNKQDLLTKINQALDGLKIKTSSNSSIGGICCIWESFASCLDTIIGDFRREIEILERDVKEVEYNEALELKKLVQEEGKLKKQIEENERKAKNESDPEKKKKFMLLATEAKDKWKKLLERKKQLKSASLGDDFNPNKHIENFLQGLKDKLDGKPSGRNPRLGSTNSGRNSTPTTNPTSVLESFQPTSNQNPQSNKHLIIFGAIVALLIFYFYYSQEEEPNYYDF